MLPTLADTATAPRIRQYEQVQRRAVLNPSVNFTRKRTVPQWHAASISSFSIRLHRQVPELCRRFLLTHALREKRLFDHAARRFDRLLDSILSNGSPWTSRTSIGPPGTASSKTPMASRPVYHANVSRLVRFFLKIGPCAC